MPSGPIPPNPAELLGSSRAHEVFKAILHYFDIIIIDGPPVLPVTDPVIISQHAHATLVVARSGKSRRDEVGRTLETLAQANAPVIGFVLNSMPKSHRYGYGRYGFGRNHYGYGYGYGYGQTPRRRGPLPIPTAKTTEVWVPDESSIWTETDGDSSPTTPFGTAQTHHGFETSPSRRSDNSGDNDLDDSAAAEVDNLLADGGLDLPPTPVSGRGRT